MVMGKLPKMAPKSKSISVAMVDGALKLPPKMVMVACIVSITLYIVFFDDEPEGTIVAAAPIALTTQLGLNTLMMPEMGWMPVPDIERIDLTGLVSYVPYFMGAGLCVAWFAIFVGTYGHLSSPALPGQYGPPVTQFQLEKETTSEPVNSGKLIKGGKFDKETFIKNKESMSPKNSPTMGSRSPKR